MANSLADLRTQLGQQMRLLGLLAPFGDHLQPQRPRHGDDVRRHRAAGGLGAQGIDEALVDLQHVHRQLLQVGEAGIAGAEVVDGDAVAGLAQRFEHGHGALRVDQPTLGDLVDQLRGRHPGGLQRRLRLGRETRLDQVRRRQVDRDVQLGMLAQQLALLLQYLADHPAGDRGDLPAVLGLRDEQVRAHPLAIGATPAQQRLGTHAAAAGQVHQRLVVQLELIAPQRLLQRARQRLVAAQQQGHQPAQQRRQQQAGNRP